VETTSNTEQVNGKHQSHMKTKYNETETEYIIHYLLTTGFGVYIHNIYVYRTVLLFQTLIKCSHTVFTRLVIIIKKLKFLLK